MENKNNNDETTKEETNSVRPFTAKDFDKKLDAFDDYIDFVTFKSKEHSVEERRARILGILNCSSSTSKTNFFTICFL
jgi:hypothetical protein